MKMNRRAIVALAAGAALALAALPAHATLWAVDFSGVIDTTTLTANVFNVVPGTPVTGGAIYSDLDPDGNPIDLTDTSVGFLPDFWLQIGSVRFTGDQDALFPSEPSLVFVGGQVVGFNFLVDEATFGTGIDAVPQDVDENGAAQPTLFTLFQPAVTGAAGGEVATGHYDFPAQARVVPEPGTMALLGTGLLALVGYGRSRRKK